jgi:4-amino-4-deoxy-L-arabinose transferase-like glycosyltransferase
MTSLHPRDWLFQLMTLSLVGAGIAILPWGDGDTQGVLFAAVVVLCLLLAAAIRGREGSALTAIVLTAFATRAVTGLVFRLYPLLPPLYTLDAESYSKHGWTIARAWLTSTNHAVEYYSPNVTVHERTIAALYFVMGETGLGSRMLSALLGGLAVLFLFRLADLLVGRRRAILLAATVAVLPSHVFWTSHTWRDPWVFCFSTLALYRFVLWLRDGRATDWFVATAAGLATCLFRMSTGIVVMLPLLLISAWHARSRLHWTLRVPWLVLCAVALTGLIVVGRHAVPLDEISPTRLAALRQGLATGGAALFPDLEFRSWGDILAFVPIGATYFLFGPFPWEARGALDGLAAAENLLLYAAVALACIRPWTLGVLRRREVVPLVGFTVLGIAAFGAIEGNLGTAYRHKMQFLPFVLLLLAPAWPVLGNGGSHPARMAEDPSDGRR